MPPAVIAAGIGAAAGIGGAVIGAKSQKKATEAAQESNQAAIAAQLEMQAKNIALAEKTRAENLGYLTPLYNAGMPAIQMRNAMLGLPMQAFGAEPGAVPAPVALPAPPGGSGTPTPAPMASTPVALPAPSGSNLSGFQRPSPAITLPNGMAEDLYVGPGMQTGGGTVPAVTAEPGTAAYAQQKFLANRAARQGAAPATTTAPVALPPPGGTATPTPTATPAPAPTNALASLDPEEAFATYRDSAGYQVQLDAGLDAIEFAKRLSSVDSGGLIKAEAEFANDLMGSYLDRYMGYLGQQQGLTSSAASSIAGVSDKYAASIAAANNVSGQAIANGAYNTGNMHLANGAINAGMWGNIANNVGQLGGSIATALQPQPQVPASYFPNSPNPILNPEGWWMN